MNVNEGFSNLHVELIDAPINPQKKVWDWYKTTWITKKNLPYETNKITANNIFKEALDGKALPTALEQLNFTFRIKNLSRVGLAQITRGRFGWAFNVESQMPEKININTTIPLSILNNPNLRDKAKELVNTVEAFYEQCDNENIAYQDSRYLILHGQTTNLIVNTNFLALKKFYFFRACNGVCDELNYVCRLIREQILSHYDFDTCSKEMVKRLDSGCAKKKVCINIDKVYGCCGRYGTMTSRFRNSSWYLELKQMKKSLLFDDE